MSKTVLTEKKAIEMAAKMNMGYWVSLQKISGCFYGCKKFKEPLYIEMGSSGAKALNPSYLFHLRSVHGFPPDVLVDKIANELYRNNEDREKMRKLYRVYES